MKSALSLFFAFTDVHTVTHIVTHPEHRAHPGPADDSALYVVLVGSEIYVIGWIVVLSKNG